MTATVEALQALWDMLVDPSSRLEAILVVYALLLATFLTVFTIVMLFIP